VRKVIGMALLWFGLCALTAVIDPKFLDLTNMQNLSRQIAMLAVIAIGEGIVVLSGGIDLSVGSIMTFTALTVAYGSEKLGYSPWLMSALALAMCALVGVLHGFMTTKLNLQPFIVTLGTMLFFRGFSRGFVNDNTFGYDKAGPAFKMLGDGEIWGIPTPVLILLGVAAIAAFYVHLTKYGVYLFAIGRNEKAASYSGVNVPRMKTTAYVTCAVLCGIGGILYATYSNSVQPATTAQGYELYAIAAAVLGGCSLRGGEGTVLGIVIGAAVLKTLINAIGFAGITSVWEFSVIGVVILAGVLADTVYKARGAKKIRVETAAPRPTA
jgi:ribose transport system permease protein